NEGKRTLNIDTGRLSRCIATTENGETTYSWEDITPAAWLWESRVAALEKFHFGRLTVNRSTRVNDHYPVTGGWSIDGGLTWNTFNSTVSQLPPGQYTVTYKQAASWTSPADDTVTVAAGETTTVIAGSYTASQGTITLTFTGTVPTGAGWIVDGITYASGQTATLSPGTYVITYVSVPGYDSPPIQYERTISPGSAVTLTAEYTEQQATPSADYTVSGASNAAANGGYNLDSSKTNNAGGPVYKNANDWYLTYAYDNDDLESNRWIIVNTFFTQGDFFRHAIQSMASGTGNTVPTSGWSGGVTVTQGS
ncbi:MAG: hypothetical protein J5654_03510, partial [Victivallales bacterium]|nr:hypothetical protein [Victivallales bacterium]